MMLTFITVWTMAVAIRNRDSGDPVDPAAESERVLLAADTVVDLTSNFSDGVLTDSNGQRYRCCKRKAKDYGLVMAEKPDGQEPLLSGCKGLVGVRYKSFDQFKDEKATCLAFESGLPSQLPKDFPPGDLVFATVNKKEHPGTFWHLKVKVVDSRTGKPLKKIKVKAVTGDGKAVIAYDPTDSDGLVNFKMPFRNYNVQLHFDGEILPAKIYYDKEKSCPEGTDECMTQIAIYDPTWWR
mmetsp:Transcript_16425/g.34322  ORF Transcript_16425/g.34322 Transcript_16425/m.34322 type:complete len:239 (-) Transcript_16425:75-791(-)